MTVRPPYELLRDIMLTVVITLMVASRGSLRLSPPSLSLCLSLSLSLCLSLSLSLSPSLSLSLSLLL